MPPPAKIPRERPVRSSDMRPARAHRSDMPAATVDEVTADLSKDPRRERDDDES
jgi:hypothetical protein